MPGEALSVVPWQLLFGQHDVLHPPRILGCSNDTGAEIHVEAGKGEPSHQPGALLVGPALEPSRRGLYGGAVGYLDFAGNLDFCIAIRTITMRDGHADIQAGAGIVADSDPSAEYEETRDKARALMQALDMADKGL